MRALVLVPLVLVALAGAAQAQPTSKHEAAATAAYDRGDLETALREFEAAYADTSRPDLLYVIGKLYAARGDCPRAIDHFERFLATEPGPNATESARIEIATCVLLEGRQPDPGPTTSGGAITVDAAAGGGPERPAGEPSGTSPPRPRLATALIGGGLVLDAAAFYVYFEARRSQCGGVCTGITYDAYQDRESRASNLRLTAVVLGAAGTAAIGVGVWRYLAYRRARRVEVAVMPAAGGGTFVVAGRF